MDSKDSLNEELNDPYVEHLRQKYLSNKSENEQTCLETGSSTSIQSQLQNESRSSSQSSSKSFHVVPPTKSLSDNERRHYLKAMNELKKAFQAGDEQLMNSLTEYQKIVRSSSENSKTSGNIDTETSEAQFQSDDNTVGKSITLATLPSTMLASHDMKTIRTTDDGMSVEDSDTNTLEAYSSETSELDIMSLPVPSAPLCVADIKAIYSELAGIYKKLQFEKKRCKEKRNEFFDLEKSINDRDAELIMKETELLEHEKGLLEREKRLINREQEVTDEQEQISSSRNIVERLQGMEIEVQDKMQFLQEQHSSELTQMENQLKERTKDCKRLKSSFDTVKEQNDQLKKQLTSVADTNKKMMVQNNKLIKRLENLQRRQDYKTTKLLTVDKHNTSKKGKENEKPQLLNSSRSEKSSKQWENMFQALSITLEWITSVHLQRSNEAQRDKLPKTYLTDKCIKLLPILTDVVRYFPMSQTKFYLPNLSFLYWSLHALDDTQNSLLSSTCRRLGEELFKPSSFTTNNRDDNMGLELLLAASSGNSAHALESIANSHQQVEVKNITNIYFRSSNVEVRFLSSLIILRTLHQVDVLAIVFDQMKRDLKEEINRELFIKYNATNILLPFIAYKANRALSNNAIDVFLVMAMESVYLSDFLGMCSSEAWFRTISSGLRATKQDNDSTMIEKLSIVLQKLSKNKLNRKLFDMHSLGRLLEEIYRNCSPENTFLSMNLRSILVNLNVLKPTQST